MPASPEYNKIYYQAHRTEFKASALKRYHNNRDHFIAKQRIYTASAPRHIKKYGLSVDDYMQMFNSQAGKCAICKQLERHRSQLGRVKWLSVDHNHITNKVRRLLCASCNQAIGLLQEDPDRAKALAIYLESFQFG